MQERLLRSEKHVRLVSAPTGAGKSYAFMRAVLDEGAHVLFIVPTKRLLQNLIEDAREQAQDRLGERGSGRRPGIERLDRRASRRMVGESAERRTRETTPRRESGSSSTAAWTQAGASSSRSPKWWSA